MSPSRAGRRTRKQGYARTWAILKDKRIALVALVASLAVTASVFGLDAAARVVGVRPNTDATAFLLGAFLVSVPWAFWMVGLTMGGGASWLAGAEAEEWTGRELNRLGDDWSIEHNVPFEYGSSKWKKVLDVDHVAVGPYGVLVVETKWTTDDLDLGSSHIEPLLQNAVEQAAKNAGRIRGLLSREVDSHLVIPVVVWWGPKVKAPDGCVRELDSVRVVCGTDAPVWRATIQTAPARLSADVVRSTFRRIGEYAVSEGQRP